MLEAAHRPIQAASKAAVAEPSILPLEVEGLVFEAGGRRPVDGLDLTLAGSSFTAIMGPNGAGKSLLIGLLHGLLTPTRGRISWAGRPPERGVRLRQGMVFQRPVLLRRSVAANLAHALRARGVKGRELDERVHGWLERAGLGTLSDRPARQLSGGEQQRLAVARALSLEPQVLFLDEPTASLDPASLLAIEELIRGAHLAGTKIVLVTHDLGQARRLADEIVFMYRGRVEEVGPADQFLTHPRSEKARAFVEGRVVL